MILIPRPYRRIALICATLVLVLGCSRPLAPLLERNELFTVRYGRLEDQIALFTEGESLHRRVQLAMSNGLIYLAGGEGNKVMQFTSFGDLLALYYNPEQNPRPAMLSDSSDAGRVTNRQAHPHPFNAVGQIAVTTGNVLLVEDRVPDRIAVFDDTLGVVLNRLVLRLDPDGSQIDYLGQEGVGGTFFPHIQRIVTTANDEVVVIAAAPPRTLIFWFSAGGDLLRRVEVSPDALPVPAEVSASPILESIHPDRDLRRLYLKVNYYLRETTGDSRAPRAITGQMSRIYWLNIDNGDYEGFVDVPPNTQRDPISGENRDFAYELIGSARGEHLFLLSQESLTESRFLILHTSGNVVRRRTLAIDYNNVVLRELHVSLDGVLTAFLAGRESGRLVWWRTDRLFGGAQR